MSWNLQYWNNGIPILPDGGLGDLQYWLNGSPYFVAGEEAASGPANLKSWNGLAKASIKSRNGLAIADIKSINGLS